MVIRQQDVKFKEFYVTFYFSGSDERQQQQHIQLKRNEKTPIV